MKKIMAIICALVMSLSMLTACDNEISSAPGTGTVTTDSQSDISSEPDDTSIDDSSSEPDDSGIILENETPKETDERLFEELINKVSETGSFAITAHIEEQEEATDIFFTSNGKATYIEMSLRGEELTVFSDGDSGYVLDTKGKKYYKDTAGTVELQKTVDKTVKSLTSLEGMTYAYTSEVTIKGKEYTAERYTNIDTGVQTCYIFDTTGKLAIVGNNGIYMPFEFEPQAEESKLSIEGYKEMTDEEYLKWASEN